MIDFLLDFVSLDTINKMKEINNESSIYDLSCNKEDCLKIIKFLKESGIENLNDLLIYEIDIFKLSYSDFIKKIKNFNIPIFMSIINEDYTSIEDIYNGE